MNEEDLKEYVVRINTLTSSGTGFFIERNKILTCYHVIENSDIKKIEVFSYNQKKPILATILDTNKDYDLALLKIETDNKLFVKINKSISSGDKCYSYGFPNKEDYYEKLDVSKENQRKDDPLTFEFEGHNSQFMKFKNGLFEKGFSGSPILNLSTGAICGMIILSRSTRIDLGGEGVSIDKLSLLDYKEQNKNEITEIISLRNGKSFDIKLVKVELDNNRTIYVGKYPITFEEYDLFCEDTNRCKPNDRGWGRDKRPVINVTWDDARDYCNWLKDKNNKEYKLLLSKDWLKIAKKNMPKDTLSNIYYNENKTCEIDSGEAGLMGIYHMYGNVDEWCDDKILMGGSFLNTSINELKNELKAESNHSHSSIGFRIIEDIN